MLAATTNTHAKSAEAVEQNRKPLAGSGASRPKAPALLALVALTKPRLSALVVLTAAAGLLLAPVSMAFWPAFCMIVATTLLVGGANSFNCYFERHVDARMHRTQKRPLVTQQIGPTAALVWASSISIVGLGGLWFSSNPLTTGLGALAWVSYVAVYTPLKRHSTIALFVGALPGALPPLMGWTAATNALNTMGLVLFAILFAWQLPHFLAISIYLQQDYGRGGLRVFSIVHGRQTTKWAILATAVLTLGASLLPVALGHVGMVYGMLASILGLGLIGIALSGMRAVAGTRWARSMFLCTLLYLPLLLLALSFGA